MGLPGGFEPTNAEALMSAIHAVAQASASSLQGSSATGRARANQEGKKKKGKGKKGHAGDQRGGGYSGEASFGRVLTLATPNLDGTSPPSDVEGRMRAMEAGADDTGVQASAKEGFGRDVVGYSEDETSEEEEEEEEESTEDDRGKRSTTAGDSDGNMDYVGSPVGESDDDHGGHPYLQGERERERERERVLDSLPTSINSLVSLSSHLPPLILLLIPPFLSPLKRYQEHGIKVQLVHHSYCDGWKAHEPRITSRGGIRGQASWKA